MKYFKVNHQSDLDNIRNLFEEIRFYMGRSVLDNKMGEAYVDNLEDPKFAYLLVRSYCFISGEIADEDLKELVEHNFRGYFIVPCDKIKFQLLTLLEEKLEKLQRHSFKKNPVFDIELLERYIDSLDNKYTLKKIDKYLEQRIKKENFMLITDNYDEDGIGVCCMHGDKIIGAASSNIVYKDGIEVKIEVDKNYRQQGIATSMGAALILACLDVNRKISWDARTSISLKLAQKLGFEYHSSYDVYKLI